MFSITFENGESISFTEHEIEKIRKAADHVEEISQALSAARRLARMEVRNDGSADGR
jgi:hypothetical protein